jgi:hypothetical protein
MGLGSFIWDGGSPLPFSVVLIVDDSGSLSPDQVPSLFTALGLIKTELTNIGTFTSSEQVDEFIVTKTEEDDERYLRWYRDFSLQAAGNKVVILNFQDEADPNYHRGDSGVNSNVFYNSDFINFQSFLSAGTKSILGAKLFVPQIISADPGSGGSSPVETQEFFINLTAPIDTHLEYVFLDPTAGGYPEPRLDSFQSELETQMLDYEVLIARNLFTVEYSYTVMRDYLNIYFAALGYNLLPAFGDL